MSETKTSETTNNENGHKTKLLMIMFAYFSIAIVVLVVAMMYALQTSRVAVQRDPSVQIAEFKVGEAMQNARIAEANARIAEANKQHSSSLRVTQVPALNPTGQDLIIKEGEHHE